MKARSNPPSILDSQMAGTEISTLKQQHVRELSKLRDFYEQKIKDHDLILQRAVGDEQQRMKRSWTWRIGTVIISPATLFIYIVGELAGLRMEMMKRRKSAAGQQDSNTKQPPPVSASSPFIIAEGCVDTPVMLDPGKVTLGCILDTFTYNCFKHEFNSLRPSPEQWATVFGQYPVQGLFIESAWRGNEGTWMNQVGKFSNTSEKNLNTLLAWCRAHKVPTIFWNKEDPVHYDYFIRDARKFDYIFTTDEGVVERYKADAGHDRVFPLPFAAQPAIHHPVRDFPRDSAVCFAGTYYNLRYVERKSDMDILLRPSLDFGLAIYDRNFGQTGEAAEQYRFPDIYQPAIKGRLDYEDMVKAYKRYKVFLNVNSIRNSSTMFARRVFELLACGTPVISTYSKGIIDILGEGTVLITDSEQDTRKHLENLLQDDHYWWRQSLRGMRTVMESHTYSNSTAEIFEKVGLPFREPKPMKFLVAVTVSSVEDVRYYADILRNQTWMHKEVILCPEQGASHSRELEEQARELFSFLPVRLVSVPLSRILRELPVEQPGDYLALFGKEHYYGINYLRDYALAIQSTGAVLLGKKMVVRYDGAGVIRYDHAGSDFIHVGEVTQGTLVVQCRALVDPEVIDLVLGKRSVVGGRKILSIDPYNFLERGRAAYLSNPAGISGDISI